MFSCIVDYTDVKPILNESDNIVEFSPLEPLHDGWHEAWISFSGGTSFVYTGVSFKVVTEPPVITNIMLQPETRTIRVCFDRQIESKDALNVNNWLLSGISGVFDEATMYPYGGGTQVLIKIAADKNLGDYALGGLTLYFKAKEGIVEGKISEGALFG